MQNNVYKQMFWERNKMRSADHKIKALRVILFLSILVFAAAACLNLKPGSGQTAVPSSPPAQQGPPCTGTTCPSLIITQSGRAGKVDLSAQGIQAAAPFAQPQNLTQNGRWTIDTGMPSPDGKKAAYTTIGSETGGPILLQDLQTGQWTNLIQAVNSRLPKGQTPLQENLLWDTIGWFPDSARLMIGPTDLSQAMIVDINNLTAREITFPSGGKGGRLFTNLAPDGNSFIYVGEDPSGSQVLNTLDLSTGKTTELLKTPYDQGVLYNPRFSPDQTRVAYLLQKGEPVTGLAYSLNMLSPGIGQVSTLVSGNLGLTIPVWSPDGNRIAFTRSEGDRSKPVLQGALPQAEASNVWVVAVADGKQTQVTSANGQARSPAWAKDGKTLAFISQDGQVNLANIEQPGQIWQAAGPAKNPALTSFFFLP